MWRALALLALAGCFSPQMAMEGPRSKPQLGIFQISPTTIIPLLESESEDSFLIRNTCPDGSAPQEFDGPSGTFARPLIRPSEAGRIELRAEDAQGIQELAALLVGEVTLAPGSGAVATTARVAAQDPMPALRIARTFTPPYEVRQMLAFEVISAPKGFQVLFIARDAANQGGRTFSDIQSVRPLMLHESLVCG